MYRTAPHRSRDVAVVCRACGARSEIADESEFVCSGCTLEQAVLREADDLAPKEVRYVDHEDRKAYDALVPLLRSLGAAGNPFRMTVSCDGIGVSLCLSLNSGVVDGVDLEVRGTDLPDLRFVRETAAHVEAKARGVAREVETGDAAFDAAVYVESPIEDAAVLTVLGPPAVRAAIERLLGMSSWVRVSGGTVSVHLDRGEGTFAPERLRACLGFLRVIAGAPRRLVASRAPVSRAAELAKLFTWVVSPLGLATALFAGDRWSPASRMPWFFGALAGVMIATALHPLLRRALSGHSRSFRDVRFARATGLVGWPLLVGGLVVAMNGAFDTSAERDVVLVIVGVSDDDDDKTLFHLRARDPDGFVHRLSFRHLQKDKLGAWAIAARFRSGAIGWSWRSSEGRLVPAPPSR